MIYMRMGKYHIGQYFRIDRQDSVFRLGLLAFPLEQTAVQQNIVMVSGKNMKRTGYFARRAVK
jgi:hypothetical protein